MKVINLNSIHRARSLMVGLVLLAALSSHAGSTYVMKKSVIAGGEEVKGGGYVLNSAIGQNATTRSIAGGYQLTAGFYQENRDLVFTDAFENNN